MKLNTKCFMSVLACCAFVTSSNVKGMNEYGETFAFANRLQQNNGFQQLARDIQNRKQLVVQTLNNHGATDMPVFYALARNILTTDQGRIDVPANDLLPLLTELQNFARNRPDVRDLMPDVFCLGGLLQSIIARFVGGVDMPLEGETFNDFREILRKLVHHGIDFNRQPQQAQAAAGAVANQQQQNAGQQNQAPFVAVQQQAGNVPPPPPPPPPAAPVVQVAPPAPADPIDLNAQAMNEAVTNPPVLRRLQNH